MITENAFYVKKYVIQRSKKFFFVHLNIFLYPSLVFLTIDSRSVRNQRYSAVFCSSRSRDIRGFASLATLGRTPSHLSMVWYFISSFERDSEIVLLASAWASALVFYGSCLSVCGNNLFLSLRLSYNYSLLLLGLCFQKILLCYLLCLYGFIKFRWEIKISQYWISLSRYRIHPPFETSCAFYFLAHLRSVSDKLFSRIFCTYRLHTFLHCWHKDNVLVIWAIFLKNACRRSRLYSEVHRYGRVHSLQVLWKLRQRQPDKLVSCLTLLLHAVQKALSDAILRWVQCLIPCRGRHNARTACRNYGYRGYDHYYSRNCRRTNANDLSCFLVEMSMTFSLLMIFPFI